MSNTQTIITQNWFDSFVCTGGECPLTCCNGNTWGIKISEEDMERYKSLSEEFQTMVKRAISFEELRFKSRAEAYGETGRLGDYCAMLTDDGWCKLVRHFGEEALCETCDVYPRNVNTLNDFIWQFVDITCPEVAKYLLSDAVLTHQRVDGIEHFMDTKKMDGDIFNAMLDAREFLTNLFIDVDGYNAGKCYLMFELANGIQRLIDSGNNSSKDFDELLSKYASIDTVAAILEESEGFNNDPVMKAKMARIAIKVSIDMLDDLPNYAYGKLDGIVPNLLYWINGIELEEDLKDFYGYRDKHFPGFISKYMIYRLQTNWLTEDIDNFASRVKLGYYVALLGEICAMSYWKTNGKQIDIDSFAYIISVIERLIFHSKPRIKRLSDNIEHIEKHGNYSFFLMPVY